MFSNIPRNWKLLVAPTFRILLRLWNKNFATCFPQLRITLTTSYLQWDRCLSSLIIKSGLGLSFGIIFSMLLFKRRAWPWWLGTGFGAGRAVEECDQVRRNTKIRYTERRLTIGRSRLSAPLRNRETVFAS